MKKLRIVLLAVAVVTAIGGAFATTEQVPCTFYQQYRKIGPNSYIYAGDYGVNYLCIQSVGICTYYKPNPFVESYTHCRLGQFQPIYP
jgi:hypothetical protein